MYKEAEKMENGIAKLQTAKIRLLESFKIREELQTNISENSAVFFNSIPSEYETAFTKKMDQAKQSLLFLKTEQFGGVTDFGKGICIIIDSLDYYHNLFHNSVRLNRMKGFKDFGLEGQMRIHAHALLEYEDPDVKYLILMLRRHEKDFFLRKEIDYMHKFNSTIKTLINEVLNSQSLNNQKNLEILGHIYFYNKYFNSIARIEKKLGVKGRFGLLQTEKNTFDNILMLVSNAEETLLNTYHSKKESIKKITIILYLSLFSLLLFSIILFTNLISNSVKIITEVFANYIKSDFRFSENQLKKSKIREFNIIYEAFSKMALEINLYTNHFKEKVEERTREINAQKEEIREQQNKIETQYQSLFQLYNEIDTQRAELKQKNDEILQSLRYAKNIQIALIPHQKEFKKAFADVFIFSKAKDVISGDFHLAIPTSTPDELLIATADCTGHGVPGALISMLGINTIQKILHLQQIYDPGALLDQIDRDFRQTLNSENKKNEVFDGMDIAIIKFNKLTRILEYCNAKYFLVVIRNGNIVETEEHKFSIGYHYISQNLKEFKTGRLELQKDDMIYLFSDGYSDQFGGEANKKFKKKTLITILKEISSFSMKNQRLILKETFQDWKGKNKQTDDVSIIGLKV